MKNFFYAKFLFIVFIACSCNTADTAANKNDTTSAISTPMAIPSNNAAKEAALKQIDVLEQLFDNQNYFTINNNDTSYFYFTRSNKDHIYTHHFKIKKGDSADVTIDTIQLNPEKKLSWKWKNLPVVLSNSTRYLSEWVAATGTFNNKLVVKRLNSQQIQMEGFNKEKLKLMKTLPLSLFLVRSNYDYKNGTHLAFDTANFTSKRKL